MQDIKKYNQLLKVYLDQINNDFETSAKTLLLIKPNIKLDTFFNIATWTWLYNRHNLNSNNDDTILVQEIDDMVEYISNAWSFEHKAINNNHQDIYLSNLSMVYAALIEAKNSLNKAVLQKKITEIRDYVFNNMLSGGMVLGSYKKREISVDQVLSVLPYGLFSPEDLVMVEAVNNIRRSLEKSDGFSLNTNELKTSKSATIIMALYFLEKSEKERADYYYNLASSIENNEDFLNNEVLIGIYNAFTEEKKDTARKIIHEPYGNNNVYSPKLTERIPHFPLVEESVEIPCQVICDESIIDCKIYIADNLSEWTYECTMLNQNKSFENLYTTRVPSLPRVSNYEYYFVATSVNGLEITSEKFQINNLEKLEIEDMKIIKSSQNNYILDVNVDITNRFLSVEFLDNKMKFKFVDRSEAGELQKFRLSEEELKTNLAIENNVLKIYRDSKLILQSHEIFAPIEIVRDYKKNIIRFQFNWHSDRSQEFYGFGERYNSINQKGNILDCFVYNQYRDQGTKTYIPTPFYLTNRGYGAFIDTNLYTKFDVCSEMNDKCTWYVNNEKDTEQASIYLLFGDYKEQIKSYVELTGKPKMIPSWALGPWMSSNNWDRQSIVEDEIKLTNKYQIPATVLVLEQWSDETTYYMFNDALYELKDPSSAHTYEEMDFPDWGRWPDPKEMVNYIHGNNLKLILWQIPISKYLNKQNHPLKDLDEKHMIENNYVVRNADETPYRIPENWFTNSLIFDFSNKEAVSWWFNKRQYLLDIGVDGFKTDGGEFVFGNDLKFSDGKTGAEMRNKYPNDYVKSYYDFAQKNGGITFSRAGYIGAQKFPAHWAGDERSTFGAFKRSLIAGINSGLSGITFWSWDLAGFNGDIPSAELFKRSSSMAAFCPIMQYHAESKAEFNQDRTPWNIAERTNDAAVIEVYRYFANVRMNLMPYIYQEARKSSESGIPLMRALMVEFPNDVRVEGIFDEYLFGDSLLVSPIIEEGQVERKVYLPEGKWFNFWTDEATSGPKLVNAKAQVNEIPVYVRNNSAILLNVNETKKLGSNVGNNIHNYVKPLCKIYYEDDFETVIDDHLNNNLKLAVFEKGNSLCVNYTSDITDLEFEIIGSDKVVEITPL
ncbi:TIM-barrel domain-containing protein [Salipaludibacillus sp. CF4.18]|uniref:glycoside hydrolase family 31 protein n=1 Tax=Salipaludibacillus sp. CF4.18 TaxID=3373081 RepID=UPI003EE4A88B